MGSRDDDRPDLDVGQALELGRHPFHGTTRLDIAVEQVAGDEQDVRLLRDGQVHGGGEGGELALALGCGLIAEIVMSGAEMDVGGVDEPQHAAGRPPGRSRTGRDRPGRLACQPIRRWGFGEIGVGASEAPP
jgi:hypothetical protein